MCKLPTCPGYVCSDNTKDCPGGTACKAGTPCDKGFCNFADDTTESGGEGGVCEPCPFPNTCLDLLAGQASGESLEASLKALADCRKMCECTHNEVCRGSTPGWIDQEGRSCAWYNTHDKPVSLNGGPPPSVYVFRLPPLTPPPLLVRCLTRVAPNTATPGPARNSRARQTAIAATALARGTE